MLRIGLGAVLFAIVMVVVLVAMVLAIAATRRTPVEEPDPFEPIAPPTAADLFPAEARTVEQRLAEIDALHASGAITDAERDEARVRVITSL